MSTSTDALLVYGYVWGDECNILNPDGEEDDREWVDIIAERRGVIDPWGTFPPEINDMPYAKQREAAKVWSDANRAEIGAYLETKKAIEVEYGVEIGHHGSDSWRVPIVKIANVGHRAYRGDVISIDPTALAVDPAWNEKLSRFIADLGIDTSEAQGPGWFLVSWWG